MATTTVFLTPPTRQLNMQFHLSFFVKTNVDYQVVGSFAVQDETTPSITEALQFFKDANPFWNPKCFLVDNCEEEIASIAHIFPNCHILLCNFHREQAWERWLSLTSHDMRSVKDQALVFLRKIADSESEEQYLKNVKELKEAVLWKSDSSGKFRDYIDKTWLPVHKKWVKAYRIVTSSMNFYENIKTDL